jgi:hypothetical protein
VISHPCVSMEADSWAGGSWGRDRRKLQILLRLRGFLQQTLEMESQAFSNLPPGQGSAAVSGLWPG